MRFVASTTPCFFLIYSLTLNEFVREAYSFVPSSSRILTLEKLTFAPQPGVIKKAHITDETDTIPIRTKASLCYRDHKINDKLTKNRRSLLQSILSTTLGLLLTPCLASASDPKKKCTDIESCREIGEKKVEKDLIDNPIYALPDGIHYKILQPGTGDTTVNAQSNIDLIYSISTASGSYMYSQGFGYEKVDLGGGQKQSDAGLDSLRVRVGQLDVPVGIERALVGMKKGEKRRVEVPPGVGFETSEWRPEPTTRRGKAQIVGYRRILEGFGSQPPFPAATVWDIQVLKIRD